MEIIKVFDINELAQEFMNAPKTEKKGADMYLMYDYETDSGEYEWTGITFIDTIKFKHTKEKDISLYMLKAYNSVVELKDSVWINEDVSVIKKESKNGKLKHYLVYFDGYGGYEFISKGVILGIKE